MNELTQAEKELIVAVRNAPPHAEFEVVKKPTKRAPSGEIIRFSVKTSKFFDLSTAQEKTTVV